MLGREIAELKSGGRYRQAKIERRKELIAGQPAVVNTLLDIVVAVYSYRKRDGFGLGSEQTDDSGRFIGRESSDNLADARQLEGAGKVRDDGVHLAAGHWKVHRAVAQEIVSEAIDLIADDFRNCPVGAH